MSAADDAAGAAAAPPPATARRWDTLLYGLTWAVGAIAIVWLAALGRLVRPISDDWCQAGVVRRHGIGALVSQYWHVNGRAVNAFVAALVQMHAVEREVLPGVLLVSACLALFWLGWEVLRQLRLDTPPVALAAASTATVAATALRAGPMQEYQTQLWAPGSITHMLPIVVLAAVVALTLRRPTLPVLVVAFLLSAAVGDTTEITSALFAAALVLVLLLRRWLRLARTRVDVGLLVVLGGLVAGAIVLAASPGLRQRQRHPQANLHLGPLLHNTGQLVERVLLHPWLAVVVVVGFALGTRVAPREGARDVLAEGRTVVAASIAVVGLTLGGCLLTVVADTTAFGIHGTFIFPRTWADVAWISALTCAAWGMSVGRVVARRGHAGARRALPVVTAAVTLVATGALCATQVQNLRTNGVPYFKQRAAKWDRANVRIIAQVRGGADTVTYHRLPIAGLQEPFTKTGQPTFATQCFEDYYGVAAVVPPGSTR